MSTVIIDASKCENAECGECVDMCPMDVSYGNLFLRRRQSSN